MGNRDEAPITGNPRLKGATDSSPSDPLAQTSTDPVDDDQGTPPSSPPFPGLFLDPNDDPSYHPWPHFPPGWVSDDEDDNEAPNNIANDDDDDRAVLPEPSGMDDLDDALYPDSLLPVISEPSGTAKDKVVAALDYTLDDPDPSGAFYDLPTDRAVFSPHTPQRAIVPPSSFYSFPLSTAPPRQPYSDDPDGPPEYVGVDLLQFASLCVQIANIFRSLKWQNPPVVFVRTRSCSRVSSEVLVSWVSSRWCGLFGSWWKALSSEVSLAGFVRIWTAFALIIGCFSVT